MKAPSSLPPLPDSAGGDPLPLGDGEPEPEPELLGEPEDPEGFPPEVLQIITIYHVSKRR